MLPTPTTARRRVLLLVALLTAALSTPATVAGAAVAHRPQVLRLSVAHGTTPGGTLVTVTGRNYAHLHAVRFGLTLAHVVSHTATKIVVKSPRHAAGLVDVRVITGAGNSAKTTADRFRYVTPLTISTSSLPGVLTGAAYSKTASAAGGFGARTWSATGLPTGIHISAGGLLSGVPSTAGTSQVVLHARDKLGDVATRKLPLTVTQATLLPPTPGSYTAANPALTFYVANNQASLQDVSIPQVGLGCAFNTAIGEPFMVASIPLAADGSFTSTTTRTGQVFGNPATFTYVFNGFFHGNGAAAPFTGTFRESVIYTDTAVHSCTTNDQSFAVTRPVQPTQTADPPPAGSYTETNPALTFYVANNQTSLQDISIPQVTLGCAGNTATGEPFMVASIPLAPDGSFTSTTTQTGQVFGNPATFTYVFRGNFHSVDPSGVPRAAGTLRESVIYTDTAVHSCDTNDQNFTVTRPVQPTQTADPPPPGSYTETNPALTFSVAADGLSLQSVTIPQVTLGCAGNTAIGEPFTVPSVTLAPDGSFTSTTMQTGQVLGNPATFTLVFRGNFHSLAPSGVERAAGTFSESVIYTDTAVHSCTTNDQNFTVTHSP